jgi:hypothetical protein
MHHFFFFGQVGEQDLWGPSVVFPLLFVIAVIEIVLYFDNLALIGPQTVFGQTAS